MTVLLVRTWMISTGALLMGPVHKCCSKSLAWMRPNSTSASISEYTNRNEPKLIAAEEVVWLISSIPLISSLLPITSWNTMAHKCSSEERLLSYTPW